MLAFTVRGDEWVIDAVFRHADQLPRGAVEALDNEIGLVDGRTLQADQQIITVSCQGNVFRSYSLVTFCQDVFAPSDGLYPDGFAAGDT